MTPSSTPRPRSPSMTRTRSAAPRTASTTATSAANAHSVITGGELSLDMLDLIYNPTARTYQAPLQLKSTGGIFIIDDLGRQAGAAAEDRQPLDRAAGRGQRHPRPAVGREVHRALRHARDLLDQLPPQRDLRRRGPAPDLLQDQDRRPEPGELPEDLRDGRPEEEDAAGRGDAGPPDEGQVPDASTTTTRTTSRSS